MKIVQINAVYGKSSTGRTCSELSDALRAEGHEIYTAYGSGYYNSPYTYRIGSDIEVKLHAFFSRVTGLQGYCSLNGTKKLLRYMDSIDPDIVHLRNLHANYINLKMLFNYLCEKNIATVITLHDCWFFTGKCTHYEMDRCYKWKNGCNHCKKLKNDIPSWFFDRTQKMWLDKKRFFDFIPRLAVIGVSDWITNETRESLLKNASIIRRIYNWIDLDVFYPRKSDIKRKYNIPENKFIILSVSSSWDEKSDRFMDALTLSTLINDDMRLVLIGRGLNKGDLPDNIICIDYIESKTELASMYSTVDVYVHLSREDTFGKVVAEAMACGTPAIVYNTTALPELIGENCGYIVECGNMLSLFKAICLIKSSKKESYSKNCRLFVKENFEKNKLIKETEILYEDILSKK